MIKKITGIIALLVIFVSGISQARQVYQRFSSNEIGKLNVFGIAISQSTESAALAIDTGIKKMMRIPVDFPVYADPTYKELRSHNAVDISLFSKSAGGATYSSDLRTALNLGDNPASVLIIDRHNKVRAFCDSANFNWDRLGKIIEELLLNIDNKEAITVGGEKDADAFENMIQTDLAKQKEEEKNKGITVIDFGASKMKWFKYLGQEMPNLKIQKMDVQGEVPLYDLTNGKVSLVVIFLAPMSTGITNVISGIGTNLIIVDGLYRDFTLGEAKKGKKAVPNAFPDAK